MGKAVGGKLGIGEGCHVEGNGDGAPLGSAVSILGIGEGCHVEGNGDGAPLGSAVSIPLVRATMAKAAATKACIQMKK
jgi:hypothetical protein